MSQLCPGAPFGQQLYGQQDQGSHCSSVSALVTSHLKSSVQFLAPHNQKDIEVRECVQRKEKEMEKSLEHKSDEVQLSELGVFIMEERRLRGNCHSLKLPERRL